MLTNATMKISWTERMTKFSSNSGGNMTSPQWQDIEDKLALVLINGGTVTLDVEHEDGCQSSLQVRAEGGNFVVMLGKETNDGWKVRAYENLTARNTEISILGDVWNGRIVCQNIDFVIAAYREFFETGDVSQCILSG